MMHVSDSDRPGIENGQKKGRGGRLLFLLMYGAIAFTGMPVSYAYAASTAYSHSMICDADLPRPDSVTGSEKILQTPHGSVAYYRFGQGSPIVLITGYRSTPSEWDAYFIGALAEQHEVIIYDNRGVGRSASDNDNFGVKEMADDSARLISSLGLRDVTVIGWSMGGIIAQQLALDDPSNINRLVLMNTMSPGRSGVGPSPEVIKTLSGEGPEHFTATMKLLFPAAVQQDADKCFIKDMLAPKDYSPTAIAAPVAYAQEKIMDKWSRQDAVYRELSKISVPVLILSGQNDTVLPPQNAHALLKVLPQATLTEVPNAGHAMMYQYPQALAALITTFIQSGNTH